MAKEETSSEKSKIIEPIEVEGVSEKRIDKDVWKPRTSVGKKVKEGSIKGIDEVLDSNKKILEPEIVDLLLPNMATDLLMVGQSKGKFGGGQKRVFRQTQKKTQEGNKPKFATIAVIGNSDGYVGIGYGKSKETVPAREKSIRNAKINLIKIRRGCGDWRCGCGEPHTVPFTVEGKAGSVIVKLRPAPKGTGLKIENECGKMLKMAGIKDVWAKAYGQTSAKINLFYACFNALKRLMEVKVTQENSKALGIVEGSAARAKE